MSPTSWRTSSRASRRTPGQGAGSGRRCTLPPLSPALPALREHWHRIAPNRARQAIVTRKAGRPDLGRRAVRATCRGLTPVTLMDLFAMRSSLSRIPSTSSAPRRVDSPVLLITALAYARGPQCALRVRGESCGLFLWRGPFSRHQEMWRELRLWGQRQLRLEPVFYFSCPWTARQRHGGMHELWCAVA